MIWRHHQSHLASEAPDHVVLRVSLRAVAPISREMLSVFGHVLKAITAITGRHFEKTQSLTVRLLVSNGELLTNLPIGYKLGFRIAF